MNGRVGRYTVSDGAWDIWLAMGSKQFVLRMPRDGDMDWVIAREAAVYSQEFGFDSSFESLVASIVNDFVGHFNPARERCWIADVKGVRMGHVFLMRHPDEPETAKLRLLMVERQARGLGIGDALVGACVDFARESGYKRIVLWTQSILTSARRTYQKAGFRLVAEETHDSFGQHLTGQTWQLDLR